MSRLYRCLCPIVLALIGSAALAADTAPASAPAEPPITPKEKIELFNGKDLTGWFAVSAPRRAPATASATAPAPVWDVKEGVITCTGRPTGYLRTEKSYTQYKVTVEWRFTRQGNTGVLVHITPPDTMTPWPKCIECQGMHDHQGDFWIWSGAKVDQPLQQRNGVIMKGPSNEKPVGEWNTYQVVCKDDTVTIIVNDKEMGKVTGCNITSGQIGLQSEGAAIEVRKVTLEPLGP